MVGTRKREIDYLGKGRILFQNLDGSLYKLLGNFIYYKATNGLRWERKLFAPFYSFERILCKSRILSRLTRSEIRLFIKLDDNNIISATKRGVFYSKGKNNVLLPSKILGFIDNIGYPINICFDEKKRIIWGEYIGNKERRVINVFASYDLGETFEVVYKFKKGEIRHIHNIIYDPYSKNYWVFCGDFNNESGIGLLDNDLKRFEWLLRGKQLYRCVAAFALRDYILYATDTEYDNNYICLLDKSTLNVHKIIEIEGGALQYNKCGGYYVFSTAAEPKKGSFKNYHWKKAAIYILDEQLRGEKIIEGKKDYFHPKLFQYGTFILPKGQNNSNYLVFSGQALKSLDGEIYGINI